MLFFYFVMADITTLLEEAKKLEVKGKYSEANDILTGAITHAQSNEPLLASLFNHRGIVNRMLMQYDNAFSDYQTALKFGLDNEQRAFAHINMADIYRVAHSNFDAAHKCLDDALNYVEDGTLMHIKAVDQRGLVFVGQKDYDSAISSYEKARDICEKLLKSNSENKDIQNRFGQIVHHLGVAYLLLGDKNKVEDAYKSQLTALDTFIKLGDQQGIVNAVTTLGRIALIKKNYDETIVKYRKAWDILTDTEYKRGITSLALHLAEAYLNKEEKEKAVPYLKRFRDGILGEEITNHDRNLLKDRFDNLLELYGSSGLKIENFEKVEAIFN